MGGLIRVLSHAETFGLRAISGAMGGCPPPPPDPPPPPPPPPACPPPPPSPTTEPHVVATPAGAAPGSYWVEGAEWHYISSGGIEHAATGAAVSTPSGAAAGSYGVEGENWMYIDASGVKRTLVKTSLGANANRAGSYWVDSGATAGKQWQWLSGTARYQHWNGV